MGWPAGMERGTPSDRSWAARCGPWRTLATNSRSAAVLLGWGRPASSSGMDRRSARWEAVGPIARSMRAMCFYGTNILLPPRLIVGGAFSAAGGLAANNIAQFDLGGWAAMGTGMDGQINAVQQFGSGTGGRLIATGEFTHAGGVACN